MGTHGKGKLEEKESSARVQVVERVERERERPELCEGGCSVRREGEEGYYDRERFLREKPHQQ